MAVKRTKDDDEDRSDQQITMIPRNETESQASFLSLPQELRDHIYDLAMPYSSVHINYDGDSIRFGRNIRGHITVKGRGFTCVICRSDEDDHEATTRWMDDCQSELPLYNVRHQACHRLMNNHDSSDPRWPFALLFVCRQTHQELLHKIYRKMRFSFASEWDLYKFTTRTPSGSTSFIHDLRILSKMGPGLDWIAHHDPKKSITICKALTGVRKFHATVQLMQDRISHTKHAYKTDWKMAHWARNLLNFASLPLEKVTVFVYVDSLHGSASSIRPLSRFPRSEQLRLWAFMIRDKLLEPWDRQAVLEKLQQHYEAEQNYHEWICGNRIYYRPLLAPESRIP